MAKIPTACVSMAIMFREFCVVLLCIIKGQDFYVVVNRREKNESEKAIKILLSTTTTNHCFGPKLFQCSMTCFLDIIIHLHHNYQLAA